MILDNTFIFKQVGVPRNFDDHAVRLRQYVQDTMPMLVNGRRLLFVCPVCLLRCEDIEVTKLLIKAGQLLEIEVLDHLIIGQGRWISMRQQGLGW